MTVQLWTINDIAREVGLASSSVQEWVKKEGWMPKPYAATVKNRGLWTNGQVEVILENYKARQEGRFKNNKPKDPFPKPVRTEVLDKYNTKCEPCNEFVYDLKIHNDFMHGGKNAR